LRYRPIEAHIDGGYTATVGRTDRYLDDGALNTLLPGDAKQGLTFRPTHKDAKDAFEWMGFEARREILTMPYQPQKVWREVEIRRPTGDTARLRTLAIPGTSRGLTRK